MTLEWRRDTPALWDADKVRIVGGAPPGTFDRRFQSLDEGRVVPGEWWRAVRQGRTVGFAWLDTVWGDAEIQVATDPEFQGEGIGTFLLSQIEHEAKERGLLYLYNIVRPTHPQREAVTAWLRKRGFVASEDGTLLRAVVAAK